MAPLVPVFSAETLPDHVNTVRRNFQEKRRKGPAIDLKECALLEMMQYSCNPPQDGIPQPGAVVCKPVVRLFRRYVFTEQTAGSTTKGIADEAADVLAD
ncbi:hypothetical protein N7510_002571 [Penicillium lagena]|uniref:uncharacterized protein n=1 Tax=Penicillium lagena TaxID=94218 RepID=UPI00253F987B|nr:uncharacterized protein N7510_002571 [Penicillium lagena]KAJ5626262.1 hypothetical protein N7510_002571 [Penicillium lagena]